MRRRRRWSCSAIKSDLPRSGGQRTKRMWGVRMRHINIPVFIPHLGCPHTCVFCNQRRISGVSGVDLDSVRDRIDAVLDGIRGREDGYECEIAFFGGSFTGIPRDELTALLELARPYVESGRVRSLRCSTRPDYIDEEIIDILIRYRMTTVELGVQSTSDEVLCRCERGHTAEQSMRAMRMIKDSGMKAVGQMMTGLPGSTRDSDLQTGRDLVAAKADGVRIYPTMTFAGTALEGMLRRGEYTPPSAAQTVDRVADLCELFDRAHIPIIRIGLCYGDGLTGEGGIVAGEYECAVGEMAQSEVFMRRLRSLLGSGSGQRDGLSPGAEANGIDSSGNNRRGARHGAELTVVCPRGRTSQVIGHRRANAEALRREYGIERLHVLEDASLGGYEIRAVLPEKIKTDGLKIEN